MKVLMITCEWPSSKNPHAVPFLVQQVNFLRKHQVDITIYAFRGRKNPLNYLKAWYKVQKMIKEQKFDLVHAQFGQSALLTLPKKIPLVITYRGSDLEGIINKSGKYAFISKFLRKISTLLSTKADKIIVVSKSLIKFLPVKHDVHVIPSGIDLNLFKPMDKESCRKTLGWDLKKKYILFAGSITRLVKNYDLAFQAVQKVKKNMDVELVVMSSVIHNRVPLYLNACDCLLLTSHHEGSPNVVKEAMACNTPIVSVNVGDVEERIGKIYGNFVCRTRNPNEISQNIESVLNNPLVPNNRLHVKDLSEQATSKKIISVYKEVLESTAQSTVTERIVLQENF